MPTGSSCGILGVFGMDFLLVSLLSVFFFCFASAAAIALLALIDVETSVQLRKHIQVHILEAL